MTRIGGPSINPAQNKPEPARSPEKNGAQRPILDPAKTTKGFDTLSAMGEVARNMLGGITSVEVTPIPASQLNQFLQDVRDGHDIGMHLSGVQDLSSLLQSNREEIAEHVRHNNPLPSVGPKDAQREDEIHARHNASIERQIASSMPRPSTEHQREIQQLNSHLSAFETARQSVFSLVEDLIANPAEQKYEGASPETQAKMRELGGCLKQLVDAGESALKLRDSLQYTVLDYPEKYRGAIGASIEGIDAFLEQATTLLESGNEINSLFEIPEDAGYGIQSLLGQGTASIASTAEKISRGR